MNSPAMRRVRLAPEEMATAQFLDVAAFDSSALLMGSGDDCAGLPNDGYA